MRTFAQRANATGQTLTASSMKAGRTFPSSPRRETTERAPHLHSGDLSAGAHAFSQIPALPPGGTLRDRDARAELGGPDADLESEHGAEHAPEQEQEPQPGSEPGAEQETEPLQEGGEEPSESETPAEGDTAPESEGKSEGEDKGCTTPSDHAGILALRAKAKAPKPKKTLAYGFTFWAAKGISYPAVKIDWTGSGNKSTGTVKTTAAGMGPVEALHLKPGTYKTPQNVTARGPACGESGKKVPFFSKVSADISALAKQAEQEHCDDYKHAFDLSYGKWAGIINSIAGTPFGPGSRKKVQGQINQALKAKGDKGRKGWIKEAGRLKMLSLKRDQGDHSMKPDGDPVVVNDECTRIDATSVKGPNTKIPGPPTATLIK